jgi:Spy/CpxP family protein refolding chaperone
MKKIFGVILAGAFIAASMPLAFANQAHKDGKTWKEHKAEMMKDVNLTEEQHKQLESHKTQMRNDMDKLVSDMESKEKALRNELAKDPVDMAKVNQIQADLKNLASQKIDQRVKHMIEMRQLMKPEQYKKMSENMEQNKDHWKGRMGMGRKHPHGAHDRDKSENDDNK